ncbi:MAG: hypothetical protein ACJAZ3_000332 [Sphingobacteriales bacterium]|jgi:hypothetical protein
MHKFLFTLLSVVLFSFQISAQTGEVRGYVFDNSTGEPIIFTNVYLQGTTRGAATDVNGFYTIAQVPEGNYVLMSTSLGYDTIKVDIVVEPNRIISKNLTLDPSSIELLEVEITSSRIEATTEVQVSVTKIKAIDIKRIPTVGGEPDLAQYLQTLPGVIFTGDQGGQLYIRGGSPIQNKVIMDGMVIYNPFHSIGLFSVFETDIIRNVDVYSGGFGAEYGGRISAIMDITTRDGNKKRFAGKVGISPFTSSVLLEAPLKKFDGSGGSSSFILSAKTSYLEQSGPIFYPNVQPDNGLPYNFTDLYGKLSVNSDNGSKFSLFGFDYSDRVTFGTPANYKWDATGFGTNFVVIPAASAVLINGNFAYSSYKSEIEEASSTPRFSEINGFNSGLDFTYFIGDDELKYGLELLGFKTNFEFSNAVGEVIKQEQFTTELAFFFTYRITANRLILEPGIRAHYYASLSELSPEPRIGGKFLISDRLRFKFASGLYSQNLISATSDRDVVNLFYGFLSSPDGLQNSFNGEPVSSSLQKSRHLVTGFEFDLTSRITVNIEGYLKDFNQLISINRDKIFDDNKENQDKPEYLRTDFIIEEGLAKGVDFNLKYDYKRFYFWFVYSLGKVEKFDGLRTYNPHYDRRHNVNLVSSYTFGSQLDWELNARFNLGTGFPFTQNQGFFEEFNFGSGGINTNYTSGNGELGVIFADLNGGRLPIYHRLDVSLKKSFTFNRNTKLDAVASVTNAYNRENVFFFDRINFERVNQLPLLPSIGITMKF